VTELSWQLERFAEMIEWDLDVAVDVFAGRRLLHKSIMIMRQELGQYDGEFGELRYRADVWVQERIDPTEDVRR